MSRRSPSFSLSSCLFDQASDAFQLVIRNFRAIRAEHCGHDFLGGSMEKRLDQMLEGRLPDGVARRGREVHVPQSLFLVTNLALLLEHSELRPDRRIRGIRAGLRPTL